MFDYLYATLPHALEPQRIAATSPSPLGEGRGEGHG